MPPFMSLHFKWYGLICRVSGVLFLQNIQCTNDNDIKITWKSWYLIYSFACFAVFLAVQSLYFYYAVVVEFANVQSFTISLYVVVFTVVTLKVLVNLSLMILKAPFLLDFFRESAKYEKLVRFVAPKRCIQRHSFRLVRLALVLSVLANVSVSSYLAFEFIGGLRCNAVLRGFIKAVFIAGNSLFYLYEMLHSVVLRPCVEVLWLYIRHQHEAVEYVVEGSSNVAFAKQARKMEQIRINLRAIAALKDRLNRIWRWSIVVSGASTLLVSCICFYSAFVEKDFSTAQQLISILYTISCCLDFIDVAGLSQAMVKELRKLRQTLHAAPTCLENGAYFNQITYLRDSIKPKEIALSGSEFFSLNLPLIVSLAGSIVTYTVILVQTSESVK